MSKTILAKRGEIPGGWVGPVGYLLFISGQKVQEPWRLFYAKKCLFYENAPGGR
jgi:hypothetical protein